MNRIGCEASVETETMVHGKVASFAAGTQQSFLSWTRGRHHHMCDLHSLTFP